MNSSDIEHVQSCDLCSGSHFKAELEWNEWNVMKCLNCSLVFTSPRYTKTYLEKMYSDRYYAKAAGYFAMQVSQPSEDVYAWAKSMIKICGRAGESRRVRSLDVGCGGGRTVQAFQRSGWEGVGIDLSSKAVEAGIEGGLDLRVATVDDSGLGKFDLITGFHILEHVHSPRKFLEKCRERLQSNGYLLLEVPDYGSKRASKMGKQWPYLYPDGHLYQFKIDTLRRYFQEAKFAIIRIRRVHGRGPLEECKPGTANEPGQPSRMKDFFFGLRDIFYWSPMCRRIIRHLLWHSLGYGEFLRVLGRKIET